MLFGFDFGFGKGFPQSRLSSVGHSTDSQTAAARWLSRAFDALVLLACGLVLSRNHADPDFWGHVEYGRDVLREGIAATATYSYTAVFFPWINHETLSELAFALGLSIGGPPLLLVTKTLAGIAFIGFLIYRARQAQASVLAAQAIALLVALNLMHFWSLRPQLFSFFFFIVQLAVLDASFRNWKNSPSEPPHLSSYRPLIWALPILFGLWANTHGGFVLGIAVLAAYLGLRSVEAFWRWGSRAWPTCGALGVNIILCVAATWLNPYGWQLHHWLFEDLHVPRPEIVEWRAPQLLDIRWWQWWLLAAVSIAAVASSKCRRDFVEIVILGIVLWQSLLHLRHIPFFTILCGMWLPAHLSSLLARLKLGSDEKGVGVGVGTDWAPWQQRSCAAAALLVMLVIAAQIVEQARRIPVHRDSYPVSAFQFMADNNISGRMVVRFKWSQYAIAAFGSTHPDAGIKVAFDGRFRTCYPQSVADMYFDFAVSGDSSDARPRSPASPPPDPRRILYYARPDLVLIDRSQQLPLKTMQNESLHWTLLYQDEIAQLWGLREKYDRPSSPNYLPPALRSISSARQAGVVPWPALPGKRS